MNVIAIDPGPSQSAIVVWDGTRIHMADYRTNQEIRQWLAERAIEEAEDEFLACEWIASMGMPVGAEVFDTCREIGRMQQVWLDCGGGYIYLVKRAEVKLHLCGTSRAKDGNVIQALKDRLGGKGTKKAPGTLYGISEHKWQALALAVYFYDHKEATP